MKRLWPYGQTDCLDEVLAGVLPNFRCCGSAARLGTFYSGWRLPPRPPPVSSLHVFLMYTPCNKHPTRHARADRMAGMVTCCTHSWSGSAKPAAAVYCSSARLSAAGGSRQMWPQSSATVSCSSHPSSSSRCSHSIFSLQLVGGWAARHGWQQKHQHAH